MFNKVVLVGNLTKDIELRYAQSGSAVANTSIATSRKFTQNGERKEEVCFIDITFFGRSAEVANQFLKKGSKVLVEGRIKFDQWVSQDGSKRSKHSVIVETMQMLDSRPQNSDHNHPQARQNPTDYQQPQTQQYGGANVGDTRSMQQKANDRQQTIQLPSDRESEPPSMSTTTPEIDIDEDEIPF